MSLLKCEPGDTIDLSVALYDGAEDQYPQAKIYDTAGTLVSTVNLSHSANGLYQGTYTPDGTYKYLAVHYIIYSNSGHTTENTQYSRTTDRIYCNKDYVTPGFGSLSATLAKEDIDRIVESLEKTIEKNVNLQEILDEIRKKSEFNPKKDKVKTDIKIPVTNLREINDKLDNIAKLSAEKTKQIDYSGRFLKIDKQFEDVKKLVGSEIGVLKGNTEQAIKQISAIQIPPVDLQPILAGIDTILDQEIENTRQRVELREGIEIAINDALKGATSKQTELQEKLIKELSVIQKALPGLEAMLEALNKEEFGRVNTIIDYLKKTNQLLKAISSTLVKNKFDEEEFSGFFDLLKSNSKT
jgi:hypothetical protein